MKTLLLKIYDLDPQITVADIEVMVTDCQREDGTLDTRALASKIHEQVRQYEQVISEIDTPQVFFASDGKPIDISPFIPSIRDDHDETS